MEEPEDKWLKLVAMIFAVAMYSFSKGWLW